MIGYREFWYSNARWRIHHGAVIPLSPPHALPELKKLEAMMAIFKTRTFLMRWDECFDEGDKSEWWHVIKDSPENIDELKPKVRTKIRKGFKVFESRVTDRSVIKTEGYNVYRSSFDRYTTFERMFSEQEFLDAIDSLPQETEFWEFRDVISGQLVAFSENYVLENTCTYVTTWFVPECLKASGGYLGYYAFHVMNKYYLNDLRLKYVSDGARSISHSTNVHDFLISNFGYRRAYARLRVAYAPGIGLAVALLYPFRRLFQAFDRGHLKRISVLLEQERIRRTCLRPTMRVR